MVNGRCGAWTREAFSMIKEGRDVSAWKLDKKKPAFSGILVDGGVAGWFNSDVVESAKLRHHLIAIHVCEDSGTVSGDACREDGPKFCKSFSVMRKNNIGGSFSRETFAPKVIKRLTKKRAMAMMLEFDPSSPLGNWVSLARYYGNQLPATSIVLAVHKGKTIFRRQSVGQFRGFQLDLRPEFYFSEVNTSSRNAKASKEDSELLAVRASRDDLDAKTNSRDGNVNCHNRKALLGSISVIRRQLPESNLGWPLRPKHSPGGQGVLRISEARNVSVVQWVMGLPNRSSAKIPKDQNDMALETPELSFKNEFKGIEGTTALVIQNFGDKAGDSNENPKDCQGSKVKHKEKMALSVSFIVKELQQEAPGWPLQRIDYSERSDSLQESEQIGIQVMESEMNMLNQSTDTTLQYQIGWVSKNLKEPVERVTCHQSEEMETENKVMASGLLSNQLVLPIGMNQSVCKWFSYEELKIATSEFSTENLIGEGGCSTVYRGCLPNANSTVVKVLKSYKEARDDFLLEVNIISSIKHKHITPLIGVCMENERLISVYDYFPEGSLEENLHGQNGRCRFPWEMRFKVAVAVAEALDYLHNECSPPIIHRDVKSSNILLSEKFQPQLSDFGLAMWGSTDSSYMTNTDVVGTFGYIAPEYLMHGRVSDKIDVYAFGIVLLELLSGRRPIDFGVAKRQGSLVLLAKEVLNRGDPEALMDPKLDVDFNDVLVQRMVLAATLCINPSARLRPNVSKILKLLKGEEYVDDFVNIDEIGSEELNDRDVDDVIPNFSSKPSLSFALRDLDHDSTSSSNANTTSNVAARKPCRLKLKDYLKERQE